MRKYGEIIRISMKMQLVWRTDVIFQMVFTISKILFANLLWGMIFQEQTVVAGFTFHGMLSYYIVSSFLAQLEMSGGISEEIYSRIRGGTFSKYMVLPLSMEGYFIAQEVGVILFYLCFDLLATAVWIFLFRIPLVLTADLLLIFGALLMVVLGLLFMVQFHYFLGLLTLKYQEISTFLMIKNNLMALVTGTIVPLAIFSKELVSVMKLLPFYYVTYLPSMLLTGRCKREVLPGILVVGVFTVLTGVLWKKGIRHYNSASS